MWESQVTEFHGQAVPDYVAPAAWPVDGATRTAAPAEAAAWNWITDPESIWPPAARTFDEVGISASFLQDLVVKIIHFAGPSTTEHICGRIGLPYDLVQELLDSLKSEHALEVVGATRFNEMSFKYRLTTRGEERAEEALNRSRYASVAPVTLAQYTEVVKKQSLRNTPPSPGRILEALSQLVLSQTTIDGLARALHSGRSTLIFGTSGNGKTSILEQYARYTDDSIIIPHALYVHGQVVRIYDAAVHEPMQIEPEMVDDFGLFKPQSRVAKLDQRWLRVRRPVVVVGGELTQESLELSFDPVAHFYQAPPHLKAQDGMFVVDDFGRQRVRPEELLNRWILPMERGSDLLTLLTGESFTVPFEIALMFSTNLRPADLVDEAFLRRIPYKIEIPSPDRHQFREITKIVAAKKRFKCSEPQLDYFVDTVYRVAQEPKGAYPRDLIQIIMDSARFDGSEPELLPGLVDRALQVYFIK